MSHKYLEELKLSEDDMWFLDDSWEKDEDRKKKWKAERQEYGFDSRETWDLDAAFYLWLYERIRMYVDCASGLINMDYHTIEFKGATYTQIEVINMILERVRFYFSPEYKDYVIEHTQQIKEITELWGLVLPMMWW